MPSQTTPANTAKKTATTAPDGRVVQFAKLPDDSYLRINQICSTPAKPGLIPVSVGTVWRWVRDGRFPKPTTLGPRCTAWRAGDLRAWMVQQQGA